MEADAAALIAELTGTTGIDAAPQTRGKQPDISDLQGRRLNALTRRGIYIVNGRKVIK